VHERDIKAKPSVTKSPPHQAPFTPQEELPRRTVVFLRPEKCPALQPCARRHHLTPGDIGAATAAAPLRLDAWQNPALQPCVRRCHVTLGDIGAAASTALLHLNAWKNAWCCSHVCTATTSRLGTLALQPPLRCCISTPGKNPGTAAMCAPPPRHARGHRAAASRRPCSRVRAATTSRPGTLALQPPLRRCILMPG
jgi:hypothetical protein